MTANLPLILGLVLSLAAAGVLLGGLAVLAGRVGVHSTPTHVETRTVERLVADPTIDRLQEQVGEFLDELDSRETRTATMIQSTEDALQGLASAVEALDGKPTPVPPGEATEFLNEHWKHMGPKCSGPSTDPQMTLDQIKSALLAQDERQERQLKHCVEDLGHLAQRIVTSVEDRIRSDQAARELEAALDAAHERADALTDELRKLGTNRSDSHKRIMEAVKEIRAARELAQSKDQVDDGS